MLFRPELALSCAIIERAMMDYQMLVEAGIVHRGSRVKDIPKKMHLLDGMRNRDVDDLLSFFHDGDFDALFMAIYGMDPKEAKDLILSYGT